MLFKILNNLNINLKKLLLLSLIIPSFLASAPDEIYESPKRKGLVPFSAKHLDPAYVSDNPLLYKLSQQMFQNFFNWYSPNANSAAWPRRNLFRGFPWMNQTQKYKHP